MMSIKSQESPIIVKTWQVSACPEPTRSDVRRMTEVIERQGQIEPLQVREIESVGDVRMFETFMTDVWGSAILRAAHLLNWDNILVVVMRRYEQ